MMRASSLAIIERNDARAEATRLLHLAQGLARFPLVLDGPPPRDAYHWEPRDLEAIKAMRLSKS